jgi:hypothetical protein
MKESPQPLVSTVDVKSDVGHLDVLASIRRGLDQAREGAGRTVDEVFDGLEQKDAAVNS